MSRVRRVNVAIADWKRTEFRDATYREARDYACLNPGIEVQIWLKDEFGGWEKRGSVVNVSRGNIHTRARAEDRVAGFREVKSRQSELGPPEPEIPDEWTQEGWSF